MPKNRTSWIGDSTKTPIFKSLMAVKVKPELDLKKIGKIRTGGVLSKKGDKKELDFFLVLLPSFTTFLNHVEFE